MYWILLYLLSSEIGLFTMITMVPSIFNFTKNIICDTGTDKLLKKIIIQNKMLKNDIEKIKADNIYQDKELHLFSFQTRIL